MKLICLDFGNTCLKYAIFDNKVQLTKGTFDAKNSIEKLEQLLSTFKFTHAVLSSVVHHNDDINQWLYANTSLHILGVDTKVNFSTASIRQPSDIGADRLALCCGALAHQHKPTYTLIISLGTCVTYNFLNIYNIFLGGAISPGLALRYESMHRHTALLPLLKIADSKIPPPLIGYDTATNLHSGVLHGMADEIDGMIRRYQAIYKELNVYITGGDMPNLLPHLKSKIFADAELLTKGLLWIAYENF